MATEVKVPELPESVEEATVGEWQKSAGDRVERDENLLDLETDKVVLEVPAVAAGVLAEVKVESGATVTTGDVLAILEEGQEADQKAEESGAAETEKDTGEAEDTGARAAEAEPAQEPAKPEAAAAESAEGGTQEGPVVSPAANKLMAENDIAARDVQGSGKDGRVTKADVQQALEARKQRSKTPAEDRGPASEPVAPEEESSTVELQALGDTGGGRAEQRVPMTRIRARIAERLLDVSQNTAMLTTFNEVDMQQVISLRKQYRDKFEQDYEVRLGFMSFFVKAAVEALKRFPIVNASIDAGDVVYHGYYDIGMAVSSPRGLLVPVLRNADTLSFARIEATIRDFGARAQTGKITMDELTGGTFTITNGGVFGSWLSTPIINPPQAAILGMHATKDRPVALDGEIVIRPMMMLALSYDHRLIDGRDAVLFLRTIKELLEDPARLLLQV
jgi:2-oxoglutarate dehydrogenase E2 component (dihydrolipoamide succinyltransferase)